MGKGMGREEGNDEGYGKWVELADLPTPHMFTVAKAILEVLTVL